MSAPPIPPRFRCYLCRQSEKNVMATHRLFSGTYCGGGFPTCDQHLAEVTTEVLSVFARKVTWGSSRPSVASDYRCVCYRVVIEDDGYPRIGPTVWTAFLKKAA